MPSMSTAPITRKKRAATTRAMPAKSRQAQHMDARQKSGLCVRCDSRRHPKSKRYCEVHLAAERERMRTRTGSKPRQKWHRGRPPIT